MQTLHLGQMLFFHPNPSTLAVRRASSVGSVNRVSVSDAYKCYGGVPRPYPAHDIISIS
jgi:hypothetical protein